MSEIRQHIHSLIDQLDPDQLAAVEGLLEAVTDNEEELTEQDRRALRASEKYFRNHGLGIPFERVVAELGFTLEQIRSGTSPEE